MAGRPILWRIYVPPVTIRVIPENEIPPAWRVDIYYKLFKRSSKNLSNHLYNKVDLFRDMLSVSPEKILFKVI